MYAQNLATSRTMGWLLTIVLLTSLNTGCVRRRLTVRSNPPGAMVYIDDQQIGLTPVSTSFIYYGTRKVRLVKDGFETVTTLTNVNAPWYQYPPLDFVSENLLGREVRDERILDFNLQPQRIVPKNELLTRADNLRQSALNGFVAPTPTVPRVLIAPNQLPVAPPAVVPQ